MDGVTVMRETLLEILDNYLSAKTKPFTGNALANFICHNADYDEGY